MNIAGVMIGPNHPCRTVAELGNAHNGDLERMLQLIEAAKRAGADFCKLQLYTPAELIKLRGDGPAPEPWGSDGWTVGDLYEKARTPFEWMPDIVAECERQDIPWFTSVFGPDSLRVALEYDTPALKLAALDYGKLGLLHKVLNTGKPLIQSARDPFAIMQLWDEAARVEAYNTEIITLHCPEGYPQAQPNLRGIRSHKGFSYHGTDPLIPALAVTQGAHLVECHFMLDDEPSELEPQVSLNEWQFTAMVDMIRRAEAAL